MEHKTFISLSKYFRYVEGQRLSAEVDSHVLLTHWHQALHFLFSFLLLTRVECTESTDIERQRPGVTLQSLHNQHRVPAYLQEQLRLKPFRYWGTRKQERISRGKKEKTSSDFQADLPSVFSTAFPQKCMRIKMKMPISGRNGILKIFTIICLSWGNRKVASRYWCFLHPKLQFTIDAALLIRQIVLIY